MNRKKLDSIRRCFFLIAEDIEQANALQKQAPVVSSPEETEPVEDVESEETDPDVADLYEIDPEDEDDLEDDEGMTLDTTANIIMLNKTIVKATSQYSISDFFLFLQYLNFVPT